MANITLVLISNRPSLIYDQMTYIQELNISCISHMFVCCPNTNLMCPPGWRHLGKNTECSATRIYNCITDVETEYVKLCSDDDIIFSHWITKAVDFLSVNSDYSCCQGISYSYGGLRGESFCESVFPSILQNCSVKRVVQMLVNYGHFFYGIHRTDVLRHALKELRSSTTLPIGGGCFELCSALFTVLQGKIFYMKEPAILREPSQTRGWFGDLVLMDQSINLRACIDRVYEILKEKKQTSTLVQTINDLQLWIQYFMFKDMWGFDKEKIEYVKKNSTYDVIPANLKTLQVSKKDHMRMSKIIKTKQMI